MKKFLSFLLAFAMLATLAACGTPAKKPNEVPTPPVETEAPLPADTPTEELAAEDPTEGSPAETPVLIQPSDGNIDLTNAAVETSATEPAALGQWVKSTRYSAVSRQYETIYWRIIDVTFDCQQDIDRYNAEGHIYSFPELEDETLAYCMATYEVYFPEDFTAPDWGLTSSDLNFSARNPFGGGIDYKGVSYIGLGNTRDVSEEQTIMPGEVYTGKAVYIMVNDDVDYVFEYGYYENSIDDGMMYNYISSK